MGLGLALLAKMSWLLLFPLWVVLTAMACRQHAAAFANVPRATRSAQLLLILSMGVYVINLGYDFQDAFPAPRFHPIFQQNICWSGRARRRRPRGWQSVSGFLARRSSSTCAG